MRSLRRRPDDTSKNSPRPLPHDSPTGRGDGTEGAIVYQLSRLLKRMVLRTGAPAARKLLVISTFQLVRPEYNPTYAFWGARKAASAVDRSCRARGGPM